VTQNKGEQPTFVFVPGSWCQPEVFMPLQAELEMQGYESHAIGTSACEPGTTFESDALEVLDQIEDYENVTFAGWSRGFNIVLHAAVLAEERAQYGGHLAISHVVGLAGSADKSTIPPQPGETTNLRGRNSQNFRDLIVEIGDGQTVIFDPNDPNVSDDEKKVKFMQVVDIMCADCDEMTQIEFVAGLGSHRRIQDEPALRSKPEIPITYFQFTDDEIINPDFVTKILIPYFRARLIRTPGSHAGGFLAHPGRIADLLINVAHQKTRLPNTMTAGSIR
jgi:pimeloyl-ACP methyl ester carboxylesterase